MPRGGSRPGAGRKPGQRQKLTEARKNETIAKVVKTGQRLPLDVLLDLMNTTNDVTLMVDCAKAAAPYVHPRLSNVEHAGNQDKPLGIVIASGVPRDEADEAHEPARPN